MIDSVVVGVDAGASATRAVVCTLGGRVLGRGVGGSGNPLAVGVDTAALAAAQAVGQALGQAQARGVHEAVDQPVRGVDEVVDRASGRAPRRVSAGGTPGVVAAVVGIAGGSALEAPGAREAYIGRLGLACPVWFCGDPLVTFASGTPEPDGAVLIAGTGAVAAAVRGWTLTTVVDGLGPLLGDRGSGYWLGLEALRAAAWELQGGRSTSPLTRALAERFGTADFVGNVYRLSRGEFAALTSVVFEAADAGDATAARLVGEAAAALTETLAGLREFGGPVVLGGSLLANDTPLRARVTAGLAVVTGRDAVTGRDGAAGAAWLAARWSGLLAEDATRRLHATMFGQLDD